MSISFLGSIHFHLLFQSLHCYQVFLSLEKILATFILLEYDSFPLGFQICYTNITCSFYHFSNLFCVFGYISLLISYTILLSLFLTKHYRKFIFFCNFASQRTCYKKVFLQPSYLYPLNEFQLVYYTVFLYSFILFWTGFFNNERMFSYKCLSGYSFCCVQQILLSMFSRVSGYNFPARFHFFGPRNI